jgi:hypothetical protein
MSIDNKIARSIMNEVYDSLFQTKHCMYIVKSHNRSSLPVVRVFAPIQVRFFFWEQY